MHDPVGVGLAAMTPDTTPRGSRLLRQPAGAYGLATSGKLDNDYRER